MEGEVRFLGPVEVTWAAHVGPAGPARAALRRLSARRPHDPLVRRRRRRAVSMVRLTGALRRRLGEG